MKTILPTLFFTIFLTTFISAQEHAWVYLSDKENVNDYLANPLTMLSQRALDRRNAQGIAVDYVDVPITPSYITDISNATGITYVGASKWMNAIHVTGSQANINALETTYAYIDHIEFANDALNTFTEGEENNNHDYQGAHLNKFPEETNAIIYDYGLAANQIQMFNAHKLHEMDYTGTGKIIAVIDAGFPNVNTNQGFDKIRTNGQILGGYDFTNDSPNVYTGHSHGSNVLSFIAGYYDGTNNYVGTAPDAQFYLFISEDAGSETPAEETYWLMAAEQADYYGADILNTSLGYFTFDDPDYDYNYATDLDGNTSFITRGANIAFTRGMIVVNAAGNEGNNSSWGGRVLVPADAENVLSVGAVNASGNYASFSSRGPTSDNRLKPDVAVQGQTAYYITTSGSITGGSGTSYASPLLAGGIACLWQALPNKTNAEIVQFVKESASIYNSPNYQLGYGIPDLDLALTLNVKDVNVENSFGLYPNPATNAFTIVLPNFVTEATVNIFDILGNNILERTIQNDSTIDSSEFANGIYLVKIESEALTQTLKLIKK